MDPELGACFFHRRRRDLGEYSPDGGNKAGFDVVGGHVGDVLDVWPNDVVQGVQVRGGRGLTDLISLSFFVFSVKIWLVWRLEDIHFNSSFTHAFTVVCETPKSLAICRIGHWGVSSMIVWTFSMNSLVRVFLEVSIRSPPTKGRPMRGAVPSSVEPSGFAFEGTGNGPVVITWISRERELYSSETPISLVEHCVIFRHDRRLLLLLVFVHNWLISRRSATKKENRFSLNKMETCRLF